MNNPKQEPSMQAINHITSVMLRARRIRASTPEQALCARTPCAQCWATVAGMVAQALRQDTFRMVLPAFPWKFANPLTTLAQATGGRADQAEALALSFLAELVREVRTVRPDATLVLALDGLLATDLPASVWPDFDEGKIRLYMATLREEIARLGAADFISLFTLDDLYAGSTEENIRQMLAEWGPFRTLEDCYTHLMASPELVADYTAMKKFMDEDSSASPTYCRMSKKERGETCKALTLGFIHRSSAWSAFLAARFQGALRLSIHQWWPHNATKIGIYLCPSRDNIVSPWRGVALYDTRTGAWHLVKRHEAEAVRAVQAAHEGQAYYRYTSQAVTPPFARLDLVAAIDSIPLAQGLVRAAALQAGVAATAVDALELLVEEGCLNVIDHAYPDGEVGPLTIELSRTPGALIIGVEDRGVPFAAGQLTGGGAGAALMRHHADEVRLINLGTGGKRVELVKRLQQGEVALEAASRQLFRDAGDEVAPGAVMVRVAVPADALGIARCAFRVHGAAWLSEPGFQPETMAEALTSGAVQGFVAVSQSGEIVGHLAFAGLVPGLALAEATFALEDLRYRGQRVFQRLLENAASKGRALELLGFAVQVTAAHMLAQEAHLAEGGREAAILPGFFPEGLASRGFPTGASRISAVSFFHPLAPCPERILYAPVHHAGMLQKIVENLGLPRDVRVALSQTVPPAGDGLLELHVDRGAGRALIRVQHMGEGTVGWVERHLKDLQQSRVDCVLLDLPLAEPATAFLCAAFERCGFGFAGLVPEHGVDGDLLRLLWLNGPKVTEASLQVASPFGRTLRKYVLAATAMA